jgi:hypothetical protein
MRTQRLWNVVGMTAAAWLAGPTSVYGQTTIGGSTAVSVERFMPAPSHGAFFAVEDGDVLPRYALAAGSWLSVAARPLVLRNIHDGQRVSEGETLVVVE